MVRAPQVDTCNLATWPCSTYNDKPRLNRYTLSRGYYHGSRAATALQHPILYSSCTILDTLPKGMPGQCLGDVPEGSVHIKTFLSSLIQRHIFHDVHSLLIAVVSLNDPWVRWLMGMSRVIKHQQTCTKDSPRATIGEVNSCGLATVLRFHLRFNRPPLCNLFSVGVAVCPCLLPQVSK